MKAIDVAYYFLSIKNNELTNLKLQKLVYIAFGWYTKLSDSWLFEDTIEAWDYGPVIRNVYNQYVDCGRDIIKSEIESPDDGSIEYEFLKKIWDFYGHLPAYKLVDATHQKGTPWDSCFKPYDKVEIPKVVIKEYYAQF